jgi:hypothetical protein
MLVTTDGYLVEVAVTGGVLPLHIGPQGQIGLPAQKHPWLEGFEVQGKPFFCLP